MEQKDNDKYDLYTEHIVPNTDKKARKIISRFVYTMVFGVIFGIIAGLVMIIVFQKGKAFFMEEEPTETIKLGNNNETTTEDDNIKVSVPDETKQPETKPTIVWDEELQSQLENLNSSYDVLKAIADKVNTYSVTIKKISTNIVPTGLYNTNEAYGIVVAEGSEYYYILTDNTFINSATEYEVEFYSGQTAKLEFVADDATTGFAIIKARKEGLSGVKLAELANSNSVAMGDIVVAVGELYGFANSMGWGMVTGANVPVSDTDSEFKIISTNIIGSATSFGVVANTNGLITGIITSNYNTGTSNHISAYAIDDVANIIEKLMNGVKTSYLGIRGTVVIYGKNSNGKDMKGIYVSSIENNSPAYYAGLQPGDIIVSLGKNKTTTMTQFMNALYVEKEGVSTELKVKRKGREQYKEIVFQVVLGVE